MCSSNKYSTNMTATTPNAATPPFRPGAPPVIVCSVSGCPYKDIGFSKRPDW